MKAIWTYTSDSCGYMLFRNGIPQGGARILGTATHTSEGKIRHWKHRRADIKENAEIAQLLCNQKNAMERNVTA